ncbi:hypothetical protein PHSY_000558 [Pseudozyma hubeiensis SY62]|uniref:Uncharacterized protein n=1 Tax=Pseudozyma hubeiensis (strain SY62) TaxID=1305764 RepID=R9NWK4_PSEHS|nr:hypothetical protein PHSY_000558 [Pseudozyma hubeiensis SY62]GAC92998.1 hypothetical protein PHSY_000558 [Pseudozyma hubeiensis SY62]
MLNSNNNTNEFQLDIMPFPFLKLPREIQIIIMEFALAVDDVTNHVKASSDLISCLTVSSYMYWLSLPIAHRHVRCQGFVKSHWLFRASVDMHLRNYWIKMRTLALHVQHPPRAVKPPWFDYHPCRVNEARLIVILARAISYALWEVPVPSGLDTLELAVPRERMREVAETLDLLYPACFIWREPRGKPYTDVRGSGHASLLCMVERYDGFFNWLCWVSDLEVPLYLDTETAMLLVQHSRLNTLTIRLQYEVRESWRQLYYLMLCDQTHSTLKLLVLSCPERAQRRRLEEDLGVCLPYMSLKIGTKALMFSCTDAKDPRGSCLKSHYLGNSHDKTTCPRCCVLFNQTTSCSANERMDVDTFQTGHRSV